MLKLFEDRGSGRRMTRRNTRLVKFVRKIWEQIEVSLVLKAGLISLENLMMKHPLRRLIAANSEKASVIEMYEKDF